VSLDSGGEPKVVGLLDDLEAGDLH
jgi:hypothetical protein